MRQTQQRQRKINSPKRGSKVGHSRGATNIPQGLKQSSCGDGSFSHKGQNMAMVQRLTGTGRGGVLGRWLWGMAHGAYRSQLNKHTICSLWDTAF